jgi:hypothetical protein
VLKYRLMKRWLWLLPLIWLAGTAAAEIQIDSPSDKLATFDDIIMLQGKIAPPSDLKIERLPFSAGADGSFICGLVLKPGKNLILIGRGSEEARLRVLRLVTYPDVETAYDEKQHWARGQIVYLSSLEMIEGYPDGNFYPDNPATRGELATWLAKVKKLPVPSLSRDVYFDVPKEHWRAPYVKAVTDAGYLLPLAKDRFGLEEPISCAEAEELAVKAEGQRIADKVVSLFKEGHRQGSAPANDPARAITRAEAAMLISLFASAQESVKGLTDFEQGYGEDEFCGLNVSPEIVALTVDPSTLTVAKQASLKLRMTIGARNNFAPISKAKVDLTAIGGVPDAELYDDATHGDVTAGDLIYSLNVSYQPKVVGEKLIRVTATDRLGWEGKREAPILIVE